MVGRFVMVKIFTIPISIQTYIYEIRAWNHLSLLLIFQSFNLLPRTSALEQVMNSDPDDIASVNEQAYFTSPDAWARTLIRSGRFAEYSRPTLGKDGAPGPSRLEAMLASKNRPSKPPISCTLV